MQRLIKQSQMLGALCWLHSIKMRRCFKDDDYHAFEVSRLFRHSATSSTDRVKADICILVSSESKLFSVSVFIADLGGKNTNEKYELKSSAFSAGVLAVTPL